jgi:ankyrin repeat protein
MYSGPGSGFLVRTAFLAVAIASLVAPAASGQDQPSVRAAIGRALPVLQRSAATVAAQRGCVSCHHNSVAVITLRMARQRGFAIDARTLDAVESRTFRQLRSAGSLDEAMSGTTLSDPTPNDSYMLMAAHAAGVPRDATTAVYAKWIAGWQREGHWITSDFRPPHSGSLVTATATAVRAAQAYLPDAMAAEREVTLRRAREWLASTPPRSTEDAAFRLMGLVWAGASIEDRQAALRDLLAMQQPHGGWGQVRGYQPDAYSTGEALVALYEAGVELGDAARQKGLKFLMASRARDGTWRVRTRMLSPAEVSPPYFNTGFPYRKDEFLSFTGSCWAVMALLSALPEAAPASRAVGPSTSDDVPAWARVALFGPVGELGRLLDGGLSPNSRTDGGVTLLMMAASDADKVRLLLSRGADVKARTAAGVDALTVAATQYGTSASVRLLLDAGAAARPPDGVRVRRSPLVLASMTGDAGVVRLLIDRGADASVEALSEAVTFGHADIVRMLVAAGANVHVTESSGVNLLHWATITNRASVIPVLAAAGVEINATDDHGFTPLMYAATVDQGDAKTLEALLASGADRSIRNGDGRTPLEQARRLKHPMLAEALEKWGRESFSAPTRRGK